MVGGKAPVRRDGWDFYSDSAAVGDYVAHRDEGTSRNSLVEERDFLALVGSVQGLRCLDLGCGFGHYAEMLARHGASVVGVDRSELMLAEARARSTTGAVEYLLADIRAVEFPAQTYDLVISNLTLHYLADPAPVFRRAHQWLRGGGRFVFSVEHPVFTASRDEQPWCAPVPGAQHWAVRDYFDETDRWGYFGRKYHHTVATWINTALACGFAVTGIAEPGPSAQAVVARPELAEDLHRPLFLIVSCRKSGGEVACE